jgi:hypothetical protein
MKRPKMHEEFLIKISISYLIESIFLCTISKTTPKNEKNKYENL